MAKERFVRKTHGGHRVPRRPVVPGLLRGRRGPTVPAPRFTRLVGQFLAIVALSVVASVMLVLVGAYTSYAQTAASLKPRLDALNSRALFQTSRIYDRNGVLLYEFFDAGKRTNIPYEAIQPLLISATVAIEDKSFFTNSGIDPNGIARTLFNSFQAGAETGGASTITQQVIKNSVLTNEERAPERRYERKFKELILAQELDKLYTKAQILELYLNENFYGNLAYGIEAASETYFGVRASDLTLNQATLLAGLPQLPSVYNPINYLERDDQGGYLPGVRLGSKWLAADYVSITQLSAPRGRQVAVLRQMVEAGYISEVQARTAIAEPLRFAPQEVPLNAPHFVFYVRDLIQEHYGQEALFGGGLRITTTLDLDLQRMVQQKAYDRINELRARNINNAAVVVMQPNTGEVLAMVGSIDYNAVKVTKTRGESGNVIDGQVNVATRERQPGSALKPFTYLAAMEQGMNPETVLWDVPTDFPVNSAGGAWYTPLNYNGRFNGPVRIRTALANSLNIPAVKALRFAGLDQTLELLDRVGIKQGLKRGRDFYGLSLTLGGGEVTPLELTTAYNTLASGGRYYAPVAVLQVTDADGRVIEQLTPRPGPQVIESGLAAIISDMLSDDRARQAIWGLNSQLKLSQPAAVKTGTTNDWRDAWAAGYTPFVTVGVWTGNNNNEPTAQVESLTGGGIIWRNVMEEIFRWIKTEPRYQTLFAAPYADGVIPTEFKVPETAGVQRRPICVLPGPFGGYKEELFTRPMLTALISTTVTTTLGLAPTQPPDARLGAVKVPCTAFTQATVVRIPTKNEWSPTGELVLQAPAEGQTAAPAGTNYCLPVAGATYPAGLRRTLYLWKPPPPDPSMRVRYTWSGGGIDSNVRLDTLASCTPELFVPPVPSVPQPPVSGAVLMPDLKRLGENQARERLAALGVGPGMIYVDYQDRARLGAEYDQFAPYTVVSSLPKAGDWIVPGTTVVLGIRAPDPAPPSDQPTAAPAPDQPTAAPAPDTGQTPTSPAVPPPVTLPLPAPPGGRR